MSLTSHQDLESGKEEGPHDHPQSPPSPLPQPSQGEVNYGDSSWPLYSMYSKIAQGDDNQIAERHQKAVDGILIFSGLFSATVGSLLTVSFQDLRPNSQDTTAFYLENIYQLFANQNAPNVSSPPTLVKPPAFSPPGYAIWVNSLWLLALLLSLSGAMLATLEHRCALRYITVTQQRDYSLEKRARIRAMFFNSENGSFNFRDSSPLLFSLHLSFFLFVAGGLIYLFNINHSTFGAVTWWIVILTLLYALITVVPIFLPDELFYTPFSSLTLRAYLGLPYAVFQVCSWIKPLRGFADDIGKHHRELSDFYSEGFIEGKSKAAAESALKPSSEIDAEILERILLSLDEDQALERFFEAIPGFCNTKLVQVPLHLGACTKLRQALDGFLDRTFSSNLVSESARADRLITCLEAAYSALGPSAISQILQDMFNGRRDGALQSVVTGHSLRHWSRNRDALIDPSVRRIIASIIARAPDRDGHWIRLVKVEFGLPDNVFGDYLAHGDSALLATLIYTVREALRTRCPQRDVLQSLSQFDIRNTLPELQHGFCTLWNEIVQEANNEGENSTPTHILAGIRHLFSALHQGTDAAPTRFSASLHSVDDTDAILGQPSSYPSCNVSSHHPDSTIHGPVTTSPSIPPQLGVSNHAISPESQPILATSPDIPAGSAMQSNTDISISATANPICRSTPGGGPAPKRIEEMGTISGSIAFGSLPTPIPTPAFSHSPIVASLDSTVTRTDYGPHTQAAPSSSSTTIRPSVLPHVTSIGITGSQDDTQDPNPPIPMEGQLNPDQMALSTPYTATNSLRREDHQYGLS